MSSIRVFRVVHRLHVDEPFSGHGGLVASGRWSSRGRPVSYGSESLALAALEVIAGAGRLSRLSEMFYVAADLREEVVETLHRRDLPTDWDRRPPGKASRAVGDDWLESNRSVALRVPSVVVPDGSNYVLNPLHPAFDDALDVYPVEPLDLDPRILHRLRL